MFTKDDIMNAIKALRMFCNPEGPRWHCLLDEEEQSHSSMESDSSDAFLTSRFMWFGRVVFPNILKIIQGILW